MQAGAIRRLRSWISFRPLVVLGMVGALAFTAGAGTYLAIVNPPYQQDESSHVGYARALRAGELPTVTTPVPRSGGGEELELALDRPWPFSDPEIHVANNPPFPYLAALPLMELSDRAGFRGGSLFGLRLFDVVGAVGAIGFAFLLGRELAGGDDLVGLATAGTLSGLISITLVVSAANIDGPAFLATTAVTWALARLVRTRSRGHALHLGLWCAAAAAVRPMSLAFAAVAGLLGLAVCVRARGPRSLVPDALRIGFPTLLLTGWFYALNIHRYGDVTGSAALFDKYGTPDGPSLLSALTSAGSMVQPLHYLVTQVYGATVWWDRTGIDKWLVSVAAFGLVGAALVIALRSHAANDSEGEQAPRRLGAQWTAMAVLLPTPVVLLAQHMSGGGAGHARYLMPMLPIIAAAAAFVLRRIHPFLPVVPVAAFAVAQLTRLRTAGDLHVDPDNWFGVELGTPLGGEAYRSAAVVIAVVGAIVLVACTTVVATRRQE